MEEEQEKLKPFELIYRFRWQITIFLLGTILIGGGVLLSGVSDFNFNSSNKVQIIEEESKEFVVEVSGAVVSAGVYKLEKGSRIEDAIARAGGFSEKADLTWVSKVLNRASPLSDGQKIFIPEKGAPEKGAAVSNQSAKTAGTQTSLININDASQSELEKLWGIGPVTAQKVIEGRPYSSVEELFTRKILKQNVFEKNKDLLTVY